MTGTHSWHLHDRAKGDICYMLMPSFLEQVLYPVQCWLGRDMKMHKVPVCDSWHFLREEAQRASDCMHGRKTVGFGVEWLISSLDLSSFYSATVLRVSRGTPRAFLILQVTNTSPRAEGQALVPYQGKPLFGFNTRHGILFP